MSAAETHSSDITQEELSIMIGYCGSDPRTPCKVERVALNEFGHTTWTLPDFLAEVESAVAEIPEEFRATARVELGDPSYDSDSLKIVYDDTETSTEIAERVHRALVYARSTLQKEREAYLALKEKYEGSPTSPP